MSRTRLLVFCHVIALAATFVYVCEISAQYVETTRGCISCHESPMAKSDFCDAVPARVWRQDDKHARAFTLLHDSDSPDQTARATKQQLVRQILGFDLREAFVDDRYSRLIDTTDDATLHRFHDLGFDSQYQYLLDPHAVTAQFSFLHDRHRTHPSPLLRHRERIPVAWLAHRRFHPLQRRT